MDNNVCASARASARMTGQIMGAFGMFIVALIVIFMFGAMLQGKLQAKINELQGAKDAVDAQADALAEKGTDDVIDAIENEEGEEDIEAMDEGPAGEDSDEGENEE